MQLGQEGGSRCSARTQTGGLRLRVISRQRGSAAAVVSSPAPAASKDTSPATSTTANAATTMTSNAPTTATVGAQPPSSAPQPEPTSASAPPPPKPSNLDPVPDSSAVCKAHSDLDGRGQGAQGDTVADIDARDTIPCDALEAQLQNMSTTPKQAASQSSEKRSSDTDCAQKPKACCVLQ